MANIAIIPARAGSTRLPNKNFINLAGKPLVQHTIDAVVSAGCFDRIIVTTNSPEVKEIAVGSGVEIHDRPEEFATTRATVVSAIIAMLESMDIGDDSISYFLPTCPFRSSDDIKKGFQFLTEADSVISTSYYDEPPQLAMIEGDSGFVYPIFDNLRAGLTNSKYIQKYVKPNGGFYMSRWRMIKESGHFFNGKIKGVLLPKERSVDIDTIEDLKYAEAVFEQQLS